MKTINEMGLAECIDLLRMVVPPWNNVLFPYKDRRAIADRIHELTRWIPVGERLPTENDAINNKVYWIDKDGYIERMHYITGALYEWEAWRSDIGFCANVGIIDKPEGV